MSETGSFDELIVRLRAGEDNAAAQVYSRYANRLIALAGSRLAGAIQTKVGPEDVMQSVMRSFFVRNRAGQFEIRDWDSLWSLLVVITLRKCANKAKQFHQECRDIGREVAPVPLPGESQAEWDFVSRDPTPADAAMLAETVEQLMESLEPRDREILALRLQGHRTREISQQVDYADRTVRRVLSQIREYLESRSHELAG
jgi:RNA polymerase sigma-70 factor (ECF subfamily)